MILVISFRLPPPSPHTTELCMKCLALIVEPWIAMKRASLVPAKVIPVGKPWISVSSPYFESPTESTFQVSWSGVLGFPSRKPLFPIAIDQRPAQYTYYTEDLKLQSTKTIWKKPKKLTICTHHQIIHLFPLDSVSL